MLFTVTATFSDFTVAVEQYQADSPELAVTAFVEHAEALATYDKTSWLTATEPLRLLHIAGGLRGVWLWTNLAHLEEDEVALLGGIVVQTDPAGALRRDDQ